MIIFKNLKVCMAAFLSVLQMLEYNFITAGENRNSTHLECKKRVCGCWLYKKPPQKSKLALFTKLLFLNLTHRPFLLFSLKSYEN